MRQLLVLILSLSTFCANAQQTHRFTIYFESDSSNLPESDKQKLYHLINQIKDRSPIIISAKGYTDKLGAPKYNEKLSLERAETVVSLLKTQLPSEVNFSVNGLGSTNLISDKSAEQYLNRRVEIFLQYGDVKDTLVEVDSFREDVPEQRFLVNVDDTVFVSALNGTNIKIPPQSIQNKNGLLVHGNVEIIIKEYYHPSEILLAGLHSYSDKGLLQTGGMIYITMLQNGDTLNTKTKNPIHIRMPVINPELNNMNVFSLHNSHDTVPWKNTEAEFNRFPDYWNFIQNKAIQEVFLGKHINLTNMPVGRSYNTDYSYYNSILPWSKFHTYSKKISLNITKIDSTTLQVKAKIKYRARGRRIIGKKNLDTIFMVNYMRAFYEGLTGNLNWINCDRFFDYKDKTDFYVTTPGIKGMNVMLYFKDIHSFMPAYFSGNRYSVPNVPSNMKVIVIAVGKKGEEYYFGKNEAVIGKEAFSLKDIKIINKENLNKLMANL